MNTCANCKHWSDVPGERYDGRDLRQCRKMLHCACCDPDAVAGAKGGGQFVSTASFGCVLFENKTAPNPSS